MATLLQPPASPSPNVLIASRFFIETLVGRGGMGVVYRSRDQLTGHLVALKLLHPEADTETFRRFSREAKVLASLRHPAIVSYVAHGLTEDGRPFLAMEWLEGEDLAARLARQSLSLSETLALVRRAAEALVVVHGRGIVHRDLKPSNLFLRAGNPEDLVLLDFGVARHERPSLAVTASNAVIGTPSYMAPEQASSQSDLTPRADLFSLGCVLYECLTGHPPFVAPHLAAVLAKILFSEPTPLRAVRPELPLALQSLLDRMLAKDPAHRIADATTLLASLQALEATSGIQGQSPTASRLPTHMAGAEQQLVSVLLAAPSKRSAHESLRDTLPSSERRGSLRTALSPYGARVELLADGSLVATLLPSHGTASDQAALAARCALMLKERWPEAAVVLSTGRGTLSQHLPVGEAMDRAGQLLLQLEQLPASVSAHVLMDEVTTGLLSSHFQFARLQSGLFFLTGENLSADASRPLLGKPTPCVGREQELALMELALTTCVEEPSAQALLVVAPAGMGKSRLRHEFLRRLEPRGHPVLVLVGRGDPMSSGTAYGLLGQALRIHCGIQDGQSLEDRRARLAHRMERHLPADKALEVAAFLGELCALSYPDDDNPRLRAARIDPWLMASQVTGALVTLLKAECAQHPVLLVLEDLHWGDALTVKLVGETLKALADQPLMVLALARPEVRELFPGIWAQQVQELPLRGLSHKAGARLVREVLGPDVPDSTLKRILEQAAGNALFLEELIRVAAEGRGEMPPETVLAMLQTRLLRLDPGAREVLLAASLFGRIFWAGGVRALLGPESRPRMLEHHLRHLVELEIIEPLATSRFSSEAEYRFRHALVRDAAYGLVLDSHKPTGHRLAGEWLEQVGETSLLVLAEHYDLAQQPERAIPFYTRAAKQLFERHDMQGMLRYLDRARQMARQLGKTQEEVEILLDEATALDWTGDYVRSGERVREAMELATTASVYSPSLQVRLQLGMGRTELRRGQWEQARVLLMSAAELARSQGDSGYESLVISLMLLGLILPYLGRIDEAQQVLEDCIAACTERGDKVHLGSAICNRRNLWVARNELARALEDQEHFKRLGLELGMTVWEYFAEYNMGELYFQAGDIRAAEPYIARAVELERDHPEWAPRPWGLLLYARVLAYEGKDELTRQALKTIRQVLAERPGTEFRASESVLLSLVEVTTRPARDEEWRELQARSDTFSVEQEPLEVLEVQALTRLRRGERQVAIGLLEEALRRAERIPNIMRSRLRHSLQQALDS